MRKKTLENVSRPVLVIGIGDMGEQVLKRFEEICTCMGSNDRLEILHIPISEITDDTRVIEHQIEDKIIKCCGRADMYGITVITVVASGACFRDNLLLKLPQIVVYAGQMSRDIHIRQIEFIFMPDSEFLTESVIDVQDQKICGINAIVRLEESEKHKDVNYVVISSENSRGVREKTAGLECVSQIIYELAVNTAASGSLRHQIKGISSVGNVSFYFPKKELFDYIIYDVIHEIDRKARNSVPVMKRELEERISTCKRDAEFQSVLEKTESSSFGYDFGFLPGKMGIGADINDSEAVCRFLEQCPDLECRDWTETVRDWLEHNKNSLDGGIIVFHELLNPDRLKTLLVPLDCSNEVRTSKEVLTVCESKLAAAEIQLKQARWWNREGCLKNYQVCFKEYAESLKKKLIWQNMQKETDNLKKMCMDLYEISETALNLFGWFCRKYENIEVQPDSLLKTGNFHGFLEFMDIVYDLDLNDQEEKSICEIHELIWEKADIFGRSVKVKGSCSLLNRSWETEEEIEESILDILEQNFRAVRQLSLEQWIQGLASFIHSDKTGHRFQYPVSSYLKELYLDSLQYKSWGVQFPVDVGKKIADQTGYRESLHIVAPESLRGCFYNISDTWTWHPGQQENRISFQHLLTDVRIQDYEKWNEWRRSGYIMNDAGMEVYWKNSRNGVGKMEVSAGEQLAELPPIYNKPYIFFSYSHKDMEFVLQFEKEMQNQGYRIWRDNGIEYGVDFYSAISAAIRRCDLLCVFSSKDYQLSKFSQDELHFAKSIGKPLFVVWLDDNINDVVNMMIGRMQCVKVWEHASCKDMICDMKEKAMEEIKQALELCCEF